MISILFPTDFSENSMNAIKYALEFFKYENAQFYFMHVYQKEFYEHNDLVSRDVYDNVMERVKTDSEAKLEDLLKTVKEIIEFIVLLPVYFYRRQRKFWHIIPCRE